MKKNAFQKSIDEMTGLISSIPEITQDQRDDLLRRERLFIAFIEQTPSKGTGITKNFCKVLYENHRNYDSYMAYLEKRPEMALAV